MQKNIRNIGYAIAAFITVTLYGGVALATPPDPVDVVGDAAEGLKDQLLEVGVRVLPYAAALAIVLLGWRLARRFIKA